MSAVTHDEAFKEIAKKDRWHFIDGFTPRVPEWCVLSLPPSAT